MVTHAAYRRSDTVPTFAGPGPRQSRSQRARHPSIHGPQSAGRYSGRTDFRPRSPERPFEPSSRLLLAAYRGSVSDFAVTLTSREHRLFTRVRSLIYEFETSSHGATIFPSRQQTTDAQTSDSGKRRRRASPPTYSLPSTAYSLRGPLRPLKLWLRPRGRADLLSPIFCAARQDFRETWERRHLAGIRPSSDAAWKAALPGQDSTSRVGLRAVARASLLSPNFEPKRTDFERTASLDFLPTYSLRSTAYSLRGPPRPLKLWLRPHGRAVP